MNWSDIGSNPSKGGHNPLPTAEDLANRPPAPGGSGGTPERYWREIAKSLVAERREMLLNLGWIPPESDEQDEFWFREDHGPVHIEDLWLFALEDVRELKGLASVSVNLLDRYKSLTEGTVCDNLRNLLARVRQKHVENKNSAANPYDEPST